MKRYLILGLILGLVSCWDEITSVSLTNVNLESLVLEFNLTGTSDLKDSGHQYEIKLGNMQLKWRQVASSGSHLVSPSDCPDSNDEKDQDELQDYVWVYASDACNSQQQIWVLRVAQPSGNIQMWCNDEKVIEIDFNGCNAFKGNGDLSSITINMAGLSGFYQSGNKHYFLKSLIEMDCNKCTALCISIGIL